MKSKIKSTRVKCWVQALSLLIAFTQSLYAAEIKITFGSCNQQWQSQKAFDTITKEHSDAWIWLGDTIYGDMFPGVLRAWGYSWVKESAPYKRFRKSGLKILGTWDDHDFSKNNAGKEFKGKRRSQKYFLDFYDVPKNHPRRLQEGIYDTHTMSKGDLKIKIILLDERTFRDQPGQNSEILGDTQWKWFENEFLSHQNSSMILLVSSSQVISDSPTGDYWAQFPKEKARLFALFSHSTIPVVVISGDRHFAEISRIPFSGQAASQGYLWDFTASGLNHAETEVVDNSFNYGGIYTKNNYGLLTIHSPSSGNSRPSIRFEAKSTVDQSIALSQLLK